MQDSLDTSVTRNANVAWQYLVEIEQSAEEGLLWVYDEEKGWRFVHTWHPTVNGGKAHAHFEFIIDEEGRVAVTRDGTVCKELTIMASSAAFPRKTKQRQFLGRENEPYPYPRLTRDRRPRGF